MTKSTKWVFFGFLSSILLTSAHRLSGPYFECGPHGRFEYCIDNIPGCVIGCHCHPGYYFDTESKVCENNAKLQQRTDYRRQYVEEVIPTPSVSTTTQLIPTPTTMSLIDRNVDAIAKDADDLGDWLYNQFFKTIENQVMNKTEENPTRRKGSDSADGSSSTSKPVEQSKPTLQTRRSRRRHGKRMVKKKRSKKGLRRKLLRISEDDSLFDSSSGSSSSDSSSSYSSESCSDESESRSREREPSKGSGHNHGRKILMINKKPPIPLPSFIFMPNMETPYFPPLGLPAPPAMPVPMYPMIPVPPMIPMPMPPSSPATTEEAHTTGAPHTEAPHTTAPPHTAHPPDDEHTSAAPPDEEPPKPDGEEASEKPPEDPSRSRSSRKFRTVKGRIKPKIKPSAKETARDRFMKRVQEKMIAKHQMHQDQPYPHELFETFADHYPDFGPNTHSDLDANEHSDTMYGETNHPSEDHYDHNVNFKYLSDLIHKLNNSEFNTHSLPHQVQLLRPKLHPILPPDPQPNPHLHTHNPHSRLKSQSNPHANIIPSSNTRPLNSNRFPQNNKITSLAREPLRRSNNALLVNYTAKDNYADLGRQIAALVRKIDSRGDRQIDVNFEGVTSTFNNIPSQAILNDNGFSSRSYWERFARSPFKFSFTDDNYAHIDSNEKLQLDQLSLEDQVNNAATTPRSLDLHQLENIISLIQLIKSIQNKQIEMDIPKAPTKMSLMTPLRNYTGKNPKPKDADLVKMFFETRTKENIYNNNTQIVKTQQKSQNKLQQQHQPQLHSQLHLQLEPQLHPQQEPRPQFQQKPQETIVGKPLEKPRGSLLEPLENLMEKPEEKLKTKPQDKGHEVINQDQSHPTNLNLTNMYNNMYMPKGLLPNSQLKYSSNLHNILPQRFKIPLSRLLQHAIQPISARLQNQNLHNLNRKKYQQFLRKDNHKTGGFNNGIYQHYEKGVKTSMESPFPFGNQLNNKPLNNKPIINQPTNNKPPSYFHTVNHFDFYN